MINPYIHTYILGKDDDDWICGYTPEDKDKAIYTSLNMSQLQLCVGYRGA